MKELHHLEAEQAVLGALLFDNALNERLGALLPEHFFDPVHGRVLEQIRLRLNAGRVADAVSLKDWARTDAGMLQLGAHGVYLLKLCDAAAPIAAQALTYAEIIRDLASRRHAKRIYTEALARLASDDDVLEVLAESEAALRDVTDAGDADGCDTAEASERFIDGMDRASLQTGIHSLDARLGGLHRGELTILAGRPSMGKTALADQIARNVAEAGGAVHFASLEMPKEQLAARAMSAFSARREYGYQRVPYHCLRNGSNVDRSLLRELAREVPRSLIIDDRAAQTLAQLEHGARATRRRLKRLDLIVVDYLQLMHASRKDVGRVQEVGEISAGLKAIAKRLECPVLALSQLSRQVESRENKRPMLSDLRESGSIEQDADVVLFVYREAYYLERSPPDPEAATADHVKWKQSLDRCKHEMEAITAKQRGGPTGADSLVAHLEYDVVRDRVAA